MPNPNQLPDDLFAEYLENLLLTGETDAKIFALTKAPQEKITGHRNQLKTKWLSKSSKNETDEYNLAIVEARLGKLYEIAYKAFLQSQKQYKIIYQNDVTNPNGPTVNHRIHPKGPGDIQWLKLILDIVKHQGTLSKVEKFNIAEPLDDYLEFVEYKEMKARKAISETLDNESEELLAEEYE